MELGIGVECALEHVIESVVVGVVMHSWTWTLVFVLMLGVVESYLFIVLVCCKKGKQVSWWWWARRLKDNGEHFVNIELYIQF